MYIVLLCYYATHNIVLETLVLIFVECIVLSSWILLVCNVFSLTSFMFDCRMTELWTNVMIYVCMYVCLQCVLAANIQFGFLYTWQK